MDKKSKWAIDRGSNKGEKCERTKRKIKSQAKSLCRVGYLKIVYSWTTSFEVQEKGKKRSKKNELKQGQLVKRRI
jgi:hypothetical protein